MTYQSRIASAREAVLRTTAYFDAIDYAPTWAELAAWFEWQGARGFEADAPPTPEELLDARESLGAEGRLEQAFGRVALTGRLALLAALAMERTVLFPRKIRRARGVTRWLLRNPGVRFVALANTTALAHARDLGDLDFFVVVRRGAIWSARLLASGLYKILGRLPVAVAANRATAQKSDAASASGKERDAVCLSYFVTDDALDLSAHMLPDDDPYFRFWFLSLLPLADDGIGRQLWEANRSVTERHPRAERWLVSPDLEVRAPKLRLSGLPRLEAMARRFQYGWFPTNILERMNRDTSVVVSDQALKFHVEDRREAYRAAYQARLAALGLI